MGEIKIASEADLMRLIQIRASELGGRLFRNNQGVAWVGQVSNRTPNSITLQGYRPFHGGLGVGTGDLIGWHPIKITPEHIGKIFAVFQNCECKNPNGRGKVTAEQIQFNNFVNGSGGFSEIVKSVSEYDRFINERAPKN